MDQVQTCVSPGLQRKPRSPTSEAKLLPLHLQSPEPEKAALSSMNQYRKSAGGWEGAVGGTCRL